MPPEGHLAHALAHHMTVLGWTVVWEPEKKDGVTFWGLDDDVFPATHFRLSRARQQLLLGSPLEDVPLMIAGGMHNGFLENLVLELRMRGAI